MNKVDDTSLLRRIEKLEKAVGECKKDMNALRESIIGTSKSIDALNRRIDTILRYGDDNQ